MTDGACSSLSLYSSSFLRAETDGSRATTRGHVDRRSRRQSGGRARTCPAPPWSLRAVPEGAGGEGGAPRKAGSVARREERRDPRSLRPLRRDEHREESQEEHRAEGASGAPGGSGRAPWLGCAREGEPDVMSGRRAGGSRAPWLGGAREGAGRHGWVATAGGEGEAAVFAQAWRRRPPGRLDPRAYGREAQGTRGRRDHATEQQPARRRRWRKARWSRRR